MSELQVTAPTDTSEVCEVDLRVGGRWRFEARGPDGTRMGYGGVTTRCARRTCWSTPSGA